MTDFSPLAHRDLASSPRPMTDADRHLAAIREIVTDPLNDPFAPLASLAGKSPFELAMFAAAGEDLGDGPFCYSTAEDLAILLRQNPRRPEDPAKARTWDDAQRLLRISIALKDASGTLDPDREILSRVVNCFDVAAEAVAAFLAEYRDAVRFKAPLASEMLSSPLLANLLKED